MAVRGGQVVCVDLPQVLAFLAAVFACVMGGAVGLEGWRLWMLARWERGAVRWERDPGALGSWF